MIKRCILMALSLCTAAAGGALSPATASAAQPPKPLPATAFTRLPDGGEFASRASAADCLTGYTCWYGDINYGGWIQRYADVQTTNIAFPDEMSSWINRNTHAAAWFTGSGGGGTSHCMLPGAAVGVLGAGQNDTMVSFKIYSASIC